MTFTPDIQKNAEGGVRYHNELRQLLDELGVEYREDAQDNVWSDYTPGSYEPIRLKFFFPKGLSVLAVEGLLANIEGQPTEDLRRAVNYLNAEAKLYRFYVSEGDGPMDSELLVRGDLLPNLDSQPSVHARELRQMLTGLCAQKAIFADTLVQVHGGRSWRMIKDAMRAVR